MKKDTQRLHASIACALLATTIGARAATWQIDTPAEWQQNQREAQGLSIEDGYAKADANTATYQSVVHKLRQPTRPIRITIEQSPEWKNWIPIDKVGPSNLRDAPVLLSLGPDNYWIFGRHGGEKNGVVAKQMTPVILLQRMRHWRGSIFH